MELKNPRIAVVGLGYVGLPLAVAMGRRYDAVGYDCNSDRVAALREGRDVTLEITSGEMRSATRLRFTCSASDISGADVYIVAVPTPVDCYNRPDLAPLLDASRTVGAAMKRGAVVVYEPTVYPGCTEDECVPVLERTSGLKFNRDFFCGYSPERINPGDREHSFSKILKITSGSTPETADFVDALYGSVLENGTFKASSIKVAEAAKVIENSQRDINSAFGNELAKIFHLIGIDTNEVLEAAGTKWNFLKFRPGLVGGHCIGVDPYYLTHKAQSLGYLPEVILAGRRINDGMGRYVASEVVRLMIQRGHRILGSKVLQLGVTFKENCPDIRNSRAVDLAKSMADFGCDVDIFDPWASPEAVDSCYGISSVDDIASLAGRKYAAIVLAVAHREFVDFRTEDYTDGDSVIYDLKCVLPPDKVTARL
ncbi:MAG: nucleotide sugar dehydrogenase [Victivallaceae bacterium]|nr:nucleotide sugar dehydrogenase [Victivallaceae bacterium]